MPAFHYTAVNKIGEKHKGVIEAETEKQARQQLRNKNLTPIAMSNHNLMRYATSFQFKFKKSIRISAKELTLVTRQMATLLSAGLPVEEVLSAVAEQTEKPTTKALILSVRSKVLEGHSLGNSLKEYPQVFSNLYCSTIASGEKSGHLDLILQRLAEYIEKQYAMRQKILNALIYPSLMVLVSVGIVGFLLEYVVPKMISVYSDVKQTLPEMTQVLIFFSSIIKNEGIYILGILVISFIAFRMQLKRSAAFRERFHLFLLRLPIIGNATRTIDTARFSHTFAILSAAGVSVLEAVNRVREGTPINVALKNTHYFQPMSVHLIASGEASGQLEPMLERAANNQDAEISRLIETALALFEPAIILLMGAIVLFIVMAVLLPIFQLDQLTT